MRTDPAVRATEDTALSSSPQPVSRRMPEVSTLRPAVRECTALVSPGPGVTEQAAVEDSLKEVDFQREVEPALPELPSSNWR